MSLSLTVAAISGYDNDVPTAGARCDWPADQDLNELERWRLRQFLTPRSGHGRRVVWPIDELMGQTP
jgi:hypothetical protein